MNQLSQLKNGEGLNFFDHSSNLFGCHWDEAEKIAAELKEAGAEVEVK